MPRQRIAATGDHARAAFQAAVVLDVNQSVVAQRVDAGRAHKGTELDRAFRLTDIMINRDMALGINLVSVESELGFDIQRHSNLIKARRIAEPITMYS